MDASCHALTKHLFISLRGPFSITVSNRYGTPNTPDVQMHTGVPSALCKQMELGTAQVLVHSPLRMYNPEPVLSDRLQIKSLPYFRFPTPNFADEREGLSASDGCNHNAVLLLEQLVPQWFKGPIARSSNGDG